MGEVIILRFIFINIPLCGVCLCSLNTCVCKGFMSGYFGLPSGASSKDASPEVQDAPYSLEVAGSNPGYAIADCGWEFQGGSAQLAEHCPDGEG